MTTRCRYRWFCCHLKAQKGLFFCDFHCKLLKYNRSVLCVKNTRGSFFLTKIRSSLRTFYTKICSSQKCFQNGSVLAFYGSFCVSRTLHLQNDQFRHPRHLTKFLTRLSRRGKRRIQMKSRCVNTCVLSCKIARSGLIISCFPDFSS